VLQIDDLRMPDMAARESDPDITVQSADAGDWFAEVHADEEQATLEPALDDEPPLAEWSQLASPDVAADEASLTHQEPSPVTGDLVAGVERIRSRERAAAVIEAVARRVRSGEIVVSLEPSASSEAVLAAALASLLATSTQ
jgi:hypothetical protein